MGDTNTDTGATGAATDTGATGDATTTDNTTTPPDDLAAALAEAEKWKALSRKNEADLRKAQAAADKAQQSSMSDQEKAIAQAKADARNETLAEILKDRVKDKVAVAAAGKLADPGDAEALLGDLDQFIVGGEVDEKGISAAIAKLIEKKPYLAAAPAPPGTGSGEGGPRGGPTSTTTGTDPLKDSLESMLGISH